MFIIKKKNCIYAHIFPILIIRIYINTDTHSARHILITICFIKLILTILYIVIYTDIICINIFYY